ncbi:site-specific DNA-methyltransferase [Albibacterium sp.]|uniref:site-specific DNA-methyltransferase n=1 Tax=Albibacterium sp. TaxID=2952885 RepID=UPI002C83F745|nr:site-specific DNA-methyltransferase [Albibacterium sp.]HUH19381.1 site-specific DNA-methyltransferase [Albibacterium sp.]
MIIDKLDLQSPDFVNENIEKIADLFPNCVTESANGKAIDFDLLRQELSHTVVEGNKERYRLEWPGKREAIVTANLPTTKTLRPVREDSVDFDNTENLYIEGDNLEVLKLLQESYLGKVKMIYIDPPYNTGKDFVYKDNFTGDKETELLESGQKDEYNQRLVSNPETAGRYHSDWLSMMYPRLKLARNLLTDDGAIFISLDDNEVDNLRKLCDNIFGENNFVSSSIVISNPRGRQSDTFVASVHDYLLVYAKNIDKAILNGKVLTDEQRAEFNLKNDQGEYYRLLGLRQRGSASRREDRPDMYFPIFVCPDTQKISLNKVEGWHEVYPKKSDNTEGRWMWGKDKCKKDIDFLVARLIERRNEFDVFVKDFLIKTGSERTRKYKSLWDSKTYNNQSGTQEVKAIFGSAVMSFPKSKELLIDVCNMGSSNQEIVLDFYSGSATTAHAVMQLNTNDNGNRKFIMVQLPETTDFKSEAFKAGYNNICEIGKERIRRAASKIKEETGADIDYGFRVFRLDESNMQDVYYKPQDYQQANLDLFADNVKPDRTADDLLIQVMLDWGLPLSLKIEQAFISGKKVFKVAGDSLFACFDKGIDEEFAKTIAKEAPLRVVFRDSGFKNDTAKVNVKQLLKQLSPETEMKVI